MKFLLGSKKEFFEFVDLIKPEDKVCILTHTDLDGIASGIFLEKILESKKLNLEFIEFLDIKKDMMKKIIPILKEKKITKVFLTDLAVDTVDIEGFYETKKEFDVFLIDHHPIEENLEGKNIIKTDSGICATNIIYDLGGGLIDEEKWKWLACTAIVADYTFLHKEQFDFIKENYPDFNLETPFKTSVGKIADKLAYSLYYFHADKGKIYRAILNSDWKFIEKYYEKVKEEIDYWVENFEEKSEYFPDKEIYFYELTPKYGRAIILNIISSEKIKGKTLMGYMEQKNGLVKISARNQLDGADMNSLLKKGIAGLENAIAGGHKKASGASIMAKDLGKFKENILGALRK